MANIRIKSENSYTFNPQTLIKTVNDVTFIPNRSLGLAWILIYNKQKTASSHENKVNVLMTDSE